MLIYVASRASVPERSAMWRRLRSEGWPIVSTWIDESGEGETADFADLWHRIEREIQCCDGLILYAERDDFPLKGALVEVGIALGLGKPIAVVLAGPPFLHDLTARPIGSWIYHGRVSIFNEVDQAGKWLRECAA